MNRMAFLAVFLAAAVAHAQSGVESTDPTSLAQFQSNGTTPLAQGGDAWNTTVVVSGIVNGSAPPVTSFWLRVEVREVAQSFTGTFTHQGTTLVQQGQTSTVNVPGLTPGVQYKWRAQTWKN